jgi:hypothetical protein
MLLYYDCVLFFYASVSLHWYHNIIQIDGGKEVGSWYGSSIRGGNSHLRGEVAGFQA